MPCNRFSVLRNNLHAVDNMIDNKKAHDKFWKMRPIVDAFMKSFPETPAETKLSIDEQIMPFRGQTRVKQYIKNKPNSFGYKIFFLCKESGMPNYNLLVHQGKTTEFL